MERDTLASLTLFKMCYNRLYDIRIEQKDDAVKHRPHQISYWLIRNLIITYIIWVKEKGIAMYSVPILVSNEEVSLIMKPCNEQSPISAQKII